MTGVETGRRYLLASAAAPRKLVVGGFQTLARSGGLFDARSWSAQPGLPVLKRNELDPPVAPLLQIKGQLVSAEAIENSLLRHPALAGHLHAPMGEIQLSRGMGVRVDAHEAAEL